MLEQAKEELQMLETQYPNRFGSLKTELKSFISLLEFEHNNSMPSYSTATTQASTSRKRKKGSSVINEMMIEGRNIEAEASRLKCQKVDGNIQKRDRIDLVLEKAQYCLRKIQELKSSLSSS